MSQSTLSIALSMGNPGGGGSSPPPPGYTTGAVSFDGATQLVNAALSATDNQYCSFSVWVYFVDLTSVPTVWIVDPLNTFGCNLAGGAPAVSPQALASSFDDASGDLLIVSNADFANHNSPTGEWINFLGNVDSTNQLIQLYANDSDTTGTIQRLSTGTLGFNGLPFYIGSDAVNFLDGYLADLWIASGQYIDFSVTANRRKFISASGKPVSLGADGSTPTGTAPAVFLRRAPSADPSTFANNLGTGGGPFTITGALTAAPTSPSD